MTTVTNKRLGAVLLGAVIAAGIVGRARGAGVGQVLTGKTIPPATVQVIDPESGTSSGSTSTDVKLAPGDVILFRFEYFPVPDQQLHGMGGWLTEYVPPGTEVVGVRIIDENGVTIEPRYPGLTTNQCDGGCRSSWPGGLENGTPAQLYADTGVFYATDPRVGRSPATEFLTLKNGTVMNPEPRFENTIETLLGTSSPHYAHNAWDWLQVRAFGVNAASSPNKGTGATAFRYGSPVAGPQTFYRYAPVESGGTIVWNGQDGPWNRIQYPGGQIGFGVSAEDTVNADKGLRRMIAPAPLGSGGLGHDLRLNNPLPWSGSGGPTTRAVRFSLGEIRAGEPGFAEIALRVKNVPIDPVAGKDVDCGEIFGGDLTSTSSPSGANPMWSYFIPSPACVFLTLLFDLEVDKPLAPNGTLVTFTLRGKNLSLQPDSNVVVKVKYSSNEFQLVGTGGGTTVGNCDGDGKDCIVYPTMNLAPSQEYTFRPTFLTKGSAGGGSVANVVTATYTSSRIPAGTQVAGFQTHAIVLTKPVTVIRVGDVALGAAQVAPGGTITVSGSIFAPGTSDSTLKEFNPVLPTGFTLYDPPGPTPPQVTIGGTTYNCSAGCATAAPRFVPSRTLAAGSSTPFAMTVRVAPGATTGLYPMDLQIWGQQSSFGGDTEWYFPKLAKLPVGAPRSAPPVLTCPIRSGATEIAGTTTEPDGTIVRLYFNLIPRGQTTAFGGTFRDASAITAFGGLYGGLEVRATAQAPGELESEPSAPCTVTHVPACSDFLDNDGDGLVDFPADPGCANGGDNDEDDALECIDGADNDGDGTVDFPADAQCLWPQDPSERGECADGVDNDGDGRIDTGASGDPGCTGPGDPSEADYWACMDGEDDDGDGAIDFPDDPGCHSPNDDDESDVPRDPENKPRLLIAFDTSGSMNWNTCNDTFTGGDGSQACAGSDVSPAVCAATTHGNGVADDSRLFKVKRGIADVVAGFGEVEWGLMRFFQRPMPFACPTANASQQSGGWQGAGAPPCGGGFAQGELLVAFAPDNPYDLLAWLDGSTNYTPFAGEATPPRLDIELRGSGTTPLAGILDSANAYIQDERARDGAAIASCRPYVVVLVTDGAETCGGDPVASARALAADGVPVYVIGFATPDPTIRANLNAIATAGGTGTAIFVEDEAELSAAMAGIIASTIQVEVCNGVDDDCDGRVDEAPLPGVGAPCDRTGLSGIGVCTFGQTVCAGGELQCQGGVGPAPEVCNGLDDDCDGAIDDVPGGCTPCIPTTEVCDAIDNDCDGQIDEAPLPSEGNACGLDTGECQAGVLQCDRASGSATRGQMICVGETGPAPEICDGKDNDCNGLVDDGLGLGGACDGADLDLCPEGILVCDAAAQQILCNDPVGEHDQEVCNGQDDDCDGLSDEDWEPTLGEPCTRGTGACETSGIWVCNPAGDGLSCNAPDISHGDEVCNNLDDDCDGEIDEDLLSPVGDVCGGAGTCGQGRVACVDGALICDAGGTSSPEICNGQDDDCDTFIDETPLFDTRIGVDCTPQPGDPVIGECRPGKTICRSPDVVCEGYVGPKPEVCNGKDDDCDGMTDDFAECPSPDDRCEQARCLRACDPGEFRCPFGFYCKDFPTGDKPGEFCVPDPCTGITCEAGFECDSSTGQCVDLCAGVSCAPGEMCKFGACYDCFTLGCAVGERCVRNEDGVGICERDLCADVMCDPTREACDPETGACETVLCEPACPEGQLCIGGECQRDLCLGQQCLPGDVCDPTTGECEPDPCRNVVCRPGEACDPDDGTCIPDPCIGKNCPMGFECQIRAEQGVCVEPALPPGYDVLAAGGGACSCRVGGTPHGGPIGLPALCLLTLLSLTLRRRCRS